MGFNDYFIGEITQSLSTNSYYTTNSGNIFLNNCFFNYLTNRAIYISTSNLLNILISLSMFISCSSSSTGGAIYIATYGGFVLDKSCGERCDTISSSGQFSYSEITSNKLNSMYFVSVINCPLIKSSQYYTTYFNGGNVDFQNTNISKNNLAHGCILFIETYSIKSKYCAFYDNNDNILTLYYYGGNNPKYSDYHIFINNSAPSGIIHFYSSPIVYLSNSIFNHNIGYLFYLTSGSLILTDSDIYHPLNLFYGSLETINVIIYTYPIISYNLFDLYSTGNCFSLQKVLFSNKTYSQLNSIKFCFSIVSFLF